MTTKTPAKTKAFNKPAYIDHPLPILYSCRIRLDEEQRSILKTAYNAAQSAHIPKTNPPVGGSSVKVETQYGSARDLDTELSMSRIVVMDILGSRDTIAIPLILKLQDVLQVTVITPEAMKKAFDKYINYIFTMND